MEETPSQLVSQIGVHLARLTRPNKDALVKSLRQAANALSQIEQCLPSDACKNIEEEALKEPEAWKNLEGWKKLEATIQPLRMSILKHNLLRHNDKDIKLLVAICITETFRILSPVQPFEDKHLRDVFKLILSMFAELADTTSPYFSRRAKILETLARLQCCVLMLDFCDDLVLEMFNIFFSIVREHHQQSLIKDILLIMTKILSEEVSPALLDVILRNLIKEGKAASPAASRLAVFVIETSAPVLEPFVRGFLSSCLLDRDAVESELKEFYHEILFKIFQCAPQMLLGVIPNLTQELLIDQVDVRIKAVNLIGKLLGLPECHLAQEYRSLFMEFKNRFSDKSVEVRLSALKCAKACYMANPFGKESHEILSAVGDRLLDFDDRVRAQAVVVVCDLARSKLENFPPDLVSKTTERLRDKKISVRKKAFHKLMEVYREYCNKCFEGNMTTSDHFENIPCKVLMLTYDQDCKEFRPQNMDVILAQDLFPVLLSIEERTRHWIHFLSLFTPLHVKALNAILSQKRSLQIEMQVYFSLRKKEKDSSSEEMQRRIKQSFVKMSASFPDPSEAEEFFHKLNQMKDNKIFTALELLLDDHKIVNSQTTRDKFLKMMGEKHPYFEFLQLLSSKCSFNIFSSENVQCILHHLSSNGSENVHLKPASTKLLLAIIRVFPSLLRGSEELFQVVLEKNLLNDTLIEVLAKAGPHIPAKFSDFYPFLERICLEGTRVQSKRAVSAIASFIDSSEQFIFSGLCKKLVDSLHRGWNIPTVLQSLGCIAQYSVSAFESQYAEIRSLLVGRFFQVEQSEVEELHDPILSEETYECSASCKLKIYGLKMLVKSFLPHHGSFVTRKIDELMVIVSRMLRTGYGFDGTATCASDTAHMKLAAAKSVLRLSRRWDLHISSEVFLLTMMMAKDTSPFIRRLFLDKINKLLRAHVIPGRYACAFALATSDRCKDLQDTSLKYLEEFIKEYSREARICRISAAKGASVTDCPAYIIVYLIHILAHNSGFPPGGCLDDQVYAQFCSPLFWVIQALINAPVVSGDLDLANDAVLYLFSIFRAIKKAEDTVDTQATPKLHLLADIGICIVNTFNRNVVSSSCAPGIILLPSSFYRVGLPKKCEANVECLTHHPANESFVERVVHILKSRISMPSSTLSKRRRKYQDGSIPSSNFTCDTQTQGPHEHVDLLTVETTEIQKPASQELSRCTRKCVPSPTTSESVALHSDHSATEVSHVDKIVPSLKDNAGARRGTTAKSSKYAPAKHKETCSLKQYSAGGGALVGKKVKVLSPVDKCFHLGTVVGFNSNNNSHKISIDSGEVELFCLDSESWETISESSLAEKENILAEESNTFHSSHSDPVSCSSLHSLKQLINAFGDGTPKQTQCLANKNGIPAKGKNVRKGFPDTSFSEVINLNENAVVRRSQRRKYKLPACSPTDP